MQPSLNSKLSQNAYRYLVILVILTITTGTIFYHLVEKFSWLNSYYFSVITLTTVGYGDFTPHTDAGKLFTTVYVLAGVGIITTFITFTMRRRADKAIERRKSK